MLHGGSVRWNSPVRMLLKISQCLSPLAAHIPVSRHFFMQLISPYFDKPPVMIYKVKISEYLI